MADSPSPIPQRLAHFEIVRRLGAGGMAEVFLAKKRGAQGIDKLLVVKRILPAFGSSSRFHAMFADEAQLATRLNHPNIVQVYDFQDYGEDGGKLLSMEYVEGPDLKKVIRAARTKGERIPAPVAAFIVGEVAKGLHYAHERKDERGRPLDIVHRDVSPQNILVSMDGAVKIADFGIATANVFRDEPGVLKGKTAYMSPEQARGERVDRRTDVYSLGIVLHEMLSGRPPHGAPEGQDLLEAVRAGNVEPPSMFVTGVPPDLEAVVMTALAKDREERFPTAREFAAAITQVLFRSQMLVDSHNLEHVIARLVDHPGASDVEPISIPAQDLATGGGGETQAVGGQEARSRISLRERQGREVRHVAVVTLRVQHVQELRDAFGAEPTAVFLRKLKRTLEEIAYKRGTAWRWEETPEDPGQRLVALAVVGVGANPARSSSDAAWLAVDVHEAVTGACDGLPRALGTSVGIVRGIAAGRRDAEGHLVDFELQEPALRLAELLGEAAPAGRTWVAGGLYRIVRRDFSWGDAPSIEVPRADELKLPRNLRIYALQRPLTRDERLAQLSFAPRDLIGRDAELADLHTAYHQSVARDAQGGRGRVSARVIIGEIGIGKSALVAGFLAELPPDARVLRLEFAVARRELPFSNLGHWFRELIGINFEDTLPRARRRVAEALGEVEQEGERGDIVLRVAELATGRLVAAADEADLAHNRKLLALGLRKLLMQAASEAPLLVVVDNVQWADLQSLELVSALVRRAEPLPLLVLLVTRPDERVAPYLEGMVRTELVGLSAENQLRLVQEHVGALAGVAEVCAELIPRAAGNPFYLLELVDALLERGSLEIREEAGESRLAPVERPGHAAEALPSTLEQLIADRLNELPAAERAVIDWLSVAGGPLLESDLATLARQEVLDPVARLCARGLCDAKGDGVDVRHPLTRDVAYQGLEDVTRVEMHRALGGHLSTGPHATGLGAAMVARHYFQGRAPGEAATFYLVAAHAARRSYQLQLATRYFRRVLSIVPDADLRRLEAFEALESISRVQGKWTERRDYLASLRRLARECGQAGWVAVALARSARHELDAGRLHQGLELARQAVEAATLAESPTLEVEAQSLMAEMLRDLGDMQGSLAACDRALRTAATGQVEPRLRADVLRSRATLLLRVGRVQEAVDGNVEAIAVFRQVGARRLEARAKNSLGFAMFVRGDFEDAIALALEAIRIDLAIGGRFQIAKTLSNIGQCYARLGDRERALTYLRRARDAHQRYGDQDGRADTLLGSAQVLLEGGDLHAADAFVTEAATLTAGTGSTYDVVHEKLTRALLARSTGQTKESVLYAFEARQTAEAQAYVSFHFYAMAVEALSRVEVGEDHTGILLATTAMGAIDTLQGSEYGLETRALCCEALTLAHALQAPDMLSRARMFALRLANNIRAPELRESFLARALVARLLVDPAPPERDVPGPG